MLGRAFALSPSSWPGREFGRVITKAQAMPSPQEDAFGILLWPNPFSVTVAFVFCSLIGSFLNVVIYRLPLDRSVVLPPSACVVCGVPLKWWQNIPIFSYLVLWGRCHTCGSSYSARYALLEAFVASVGAFLFWHFGGPTWPFLYVFALFAVSTAVFFTDLDHWIIPDQLNAFGVLFGVAGAAFMPARGDVDWLGLEQVWFANVVSSLLGVIAGVAFFWSIQVVGMLLAKQEAMGGGDVKFAAAIGAFLGLKLSFVAFLLSFVLGAFLAVPMLLFGRGKGKDPIPFGTFMAIAAVVTALWGHVFLGIFLDFPLYLYGWPAEY